MSWQSRTELMFGVERMPQLHQAHVMVVGLGGVGAYAVEMLCRAGVGEFTLVDGDTVNDSNRNRQLVALTSTVGQLKTDVLAARLRDINPDVKLHLYPEFLRDERTVELLKMAHYDYLVDAIDTFHQYFSTFPTFQPSNLLTLHFSNFPPSYLSNLPTFQLSTFPPSYPSNHLLIS